MVKVTLAEVVFTFHLVDELKDLIVLNFFMEFYWTLEASNYSLKHNLYSISVKLYPNYFKSLESTRFRMVVIDDVSIMKNIANWYLIVS